MKKILISLSPQGALSRFAILLVFFLFLISPAFAVDEDNSIIDELTKIEQDELDFSMNLQSFQSCSALKDVM